MPPRLLRAPAPQVSRRSFLRNGLQLAGLSLVIPGSGAAYAAAEAATILNVTDYAPVTDAWPARQKLTITVVADLHAGGPNMGIDRIRAVVDQAQSLKSDLIVILGDFFATHRFITERVPHEAWSSELGRLKAPLGVYSILGNHDWWHDLAGVRRALNRVHIPLLENDAVLIGPAGRRVWLAGLGDQLAHYLGPSRFRGVDDLPGTLRKVTTSDPVILLAHEPDIFPQVPKRVALTLAGHTHGGQLNLPLIGRSLAPTSYGERFAYGHIVEQGRHMIVSGGLGCSKVPLRFNSPPEIVRVTLGA